MKVKVVSLASQEFNSAFTALMAIRAVPGSVGFKLRKLKIQIDAELKVFFQTRHDVALPYARKNEDGSIVRANPSDLESFLVSEDPTLLAELGPKLKELEQAEIELLEIAYSELGIESGLSGGELAALLFIVEG